MAKKFNDCLLGNRCNNCTLPCSGVWLRVFLQPPPFSRLMEDPTHFPNKTVNIFCNTFPSCIPGLWAQAVFQKCPLIAAKNLWLWNSRAKCYRSVML